MIGSDPVIFFCEICEPRCKNCSVDRKKCEECFSGYSLVNSKCLDKKRGCSLYNMSSGACNKCEYGYVLINAECFNCLDE